MTTPDPKTAFAGKPMGGLARIVDKYFGTDLDDRSAHEKPMHSSIEPPYVSQRGTHCVECGAEIKVMCFIGTGICSETCRKNRDGEVSIQDIANLGGGSNGAVFDSRT